MRVRSVLTACIWVCVWLVLHSHIRPALAGMPSVLPDDYEFSPALRDSALLRIEAISFFLFVFLVSTLIVQGLWNYLAKEVPRMPRLNFLRAISLVLLTGLLFAVVLTMISGARELMTPGAWSKDGWTYKLLEEESQP